MIFIDTSAILARHLRKDQNHQAALKYWAGLADGSDKLFTSSFVLDEAVTLLTRWVGEQEAVQTALPFYVSNTVTILRPEEADELRALDVLGKSSGQNLSFTDCISFVLMRRLKISKAFSFDADFIKAGFQTVPR